MFAVHCMSKVYSKSLCCTILIKPLKNLISLFVERETILRTIQPHLLYYNILRKKFEI